MMTMIEADNDMQRHEPTSGTAKRLWQKGGDEEMQAVQNVRVPANITHRGGSRR